ncbi:hypothetical protein F510_2758, partial [Anoxybacillus gonensis]
MDLNYGGLVFSIKENPPILLIHIIWLMLTFFKHSLKGFLRFGVKADDKI